MVIKIIIFILWFLMVGNCSHAWAGEFGSFRGKILDAETKEPIEGVVVLIKWREKHFFAGSTFYDAQETLTDKNGEFYISGIWVFNPLVWLRAQADVIIYKSGYVVIGFGPWKSFIEREWGASKGTHILKVEDGRPVIMLRRLETIEERKRNIPSEPNVPLEKYKLLREKWKLLKQEIDKEEKLLGIK